MKKNVTAFLLTGFAITALSTTALANNGYFSGGASSPQPAFTSVGTNGYFSSGSQPSSSLGANGYGSRVTQPNYGANFAAQADNTFVYGRHSHHFKGARWINMRPHKPVPPTAVAGGFANRQPFFICRGYYHDGVHPGKKVGNTCHISYGGRKIVLNHYQLLVAQRPLTWLPASHGFIPGNAIQGGYEQGRKLFICQASLNGSTHPGKIVGQNCNVSYGQEEIAIPQYRVLVG